MSRFAHAPTPRDAHVRNNSVHRYFMKIENFRKYGTITIVDATGGGGTSYDTKLKTILIESV